MNLKIQKVHGSENDFFLIDQLQLERPFTKKELEDLRIRLCDRKNGLLGGADGLLLVEASKQGEALAKMRVINSDGSEASMCGNGLRTVARYLSEKHDEQSFIVETMFADLKVRRAEELGKGVATYQVEISPVRFEAEAIPMVTNKNRIIDEVIPELSDEIKFSVVAVPNPHLIAFVDHQMLVSPEFERIAAYVNGENPLFPDGINVSFVEILGENQLFVRTYERGVGFTSACGTAMCASSLMYVLLNERVFGETVTVKNVGGIVKTVVHEDDAEGYWMELIGNASVTHLLSGDLVDFTDGQFNRLQIDETDEQAAYIAFLESIKID
ncbi:MULTISPECIES: diaminopimelate epimerase [unclassified Enterococcus]|uniref:diaminopimelate epimerase n=1 Tax=unclassified Enterococcus TaxID=2608891 RepID=UPI001CE06AFA|nr:MULTISPECIES: diaminopimelate epimerase [unclassified Enterococcus]MCA5014087.1 diaminopimelate epimerase [Enterococcus sp. S23]MCA5017139.1 diaminopimelate epimerase [Enterococcus sp. S22(2020)]